MNIKLKINKEELKVKLNIQDGKTPQFGVDFLTNEEMSKIKLELTPVKGRDYFDGKDGYAPIKGIDYRDGEKGEQGNIPKHFWNGTKLAFENPDGTVGEYIDLKGKSIGGSSLFIQKDGVDISTAPVLNFGSNLNVSVIGNTVKIDAIAEDVSATWGNITGTLSNQTDLQNALNLKANASDLSSYLLKPSISIKTTNYTATGSEANNTVFIFSSFSAGSSLVLNPALFPDGTVLAVVHKGNDGEILYVDAGAGKLMNGGQTYELNHSGNAIIVVKKSDTAWEILSEASPDYAKVYGLSAYVDSTVENLIPIYGMVGYNNLSELTDISIARTNLGLGSMALEDTSDYYTSSTIDGLIVTDHGGLTGLSDDDHTQYALLAGRSGGQTLIGGSGVTDALFLQGTSGNGTSTAEAIGLKVGNNGAKKAITINNAGQVGIGLSGTTFQSTGPMLEVDGVIEARDRIIVGRDYQAGGATGSQPLVTLYWSGERTMLGFNYTTGKLQYIGPGGTQGFEFVTLNRSKDFVQLSTDANYGLTLNTTDKNSAGQHDVAINTRFNGLGTYDAFHIKLFDSASNAESNYMALYSSASYGGVQTLKWRVRKDGKMFMTSDSFVMSTSKTPSSATDTGTQGEIAWDSNYIYVCTATNTWKRTALTTW